MVDALVYVFIGCVLAGAVLEKIGWSIIVRDLPGAKAPVGFWGTLFGPGIVHKSRSAMLAYRAGCHLGPLLYATGILLLLCALVGCLVLRAKLK